MAPMNRIVGRLLLATALACALVALTACDAGVPSGPAGITGTITAVDDATDAQGARTLRMLVEGDNQPPGAVSDKAYVTVTTKTTVFGPNAEPASMDELVQGRQADVWFDGPVAESYPVQGSAKFVRLGER